MSVTVGHNGRLCNQIIRNMAMSALAEEHDLKVRYHNYHLINNVLGIPLHSGSNVHDGTMAVTGETYFDTLHCADLKHNLDLNGDFFQEEEITNVLFQRLRRQQERIIARNPFSVRYRANEDLFIHVRLGDLETHTPGMWYFEYVLDNIPYDKVYLSTDSLSHPLIRRIIEHQPRVKLLGYSAERTLQAASTCKYIALTIGSFSAVIGYLAFFSEIYYPDIDRPRQAGSKGMFTGKGWHAVSAL